MTIQSDPPYPRAASKTSGRDGPAGRLPVSILLATYNGARYLPEQLQSYCDQSYGDWALWVSDDGSDDGTEAVIARFAADHPDRSVHMCKGPGRGAGANFLSLLARAVAAAPGAAVAFSDQDDAWLPHKLERAMGWMMTEGAGQGAALAWSSRMLLTDNALVPFGESREFPRPACFGNALVQNILHGNTIVLSPAAAQAMARTVPAALEHGVPYQDWWTYQVMTGIGADLRSDPEALVKYRQHETNHMGHHGPVRGRLRRLGLVAQRAYAGWLDANLAALRANQHMLTPEARHTLRGFMLCRRRSGAALAAALPRLGIHRQTPRGDQMLRVMALAGRL